MKDSILIEGREFISVGRAAEITKYTKDYVGQLCRAGKVAARMLGRTWFIDRESLTLYKNSVDTFFAGYGKQKDMVVPSAVVAPVISATPSPATAPAILTPSQETSVTYIQDKRPLMPILSKVSHVEAVSQNVMRIKSRTRAIAPSQLRSMRTMFMVAVLLVTVLSGSAALIFMQDGSLTDSFAKSARVNSTASVASIFDSVTSYVKNLFVRKSDTLAKAVDKPPPQTGGIVVAPLTDSLSQDEILKKKIQSSFSDEVTVAPDDTGTAGVITPVFKKATGDNFVYVLVPVKDQEKKEN